MFKLKNKEFGSMHILLLGVFISVSGFMFLTTGSIFADNGRVAGECNRITNSVGRALCLEYAAQNLGVAQVSGAQLEADCDEDVLTPENCSIIAYIRLFTDVLSVLVGIVVVMMIVIGGIQYSSAGNNPQAVAGAKKRISQALFALVAYIFMFAFLQWIVPGGVF
ncbi:hypothetical protein BH23PAT2_BH23PAT2_06050 [soil metagenome]